MSESLPPNDPSTAELPEPPTYLLPHEKRVWVNRSLRMEQVQWLGFDMDYTLAVYKQVEIDRLSVQATVKKMVDRGYPPELQEVDFSYSLPVRGLMIDKRYGHLLKMDRYRHVGRGVHGTRVLSRDERRALYRSQRVKVTPERYHRIDTLYALSEAALYAGAVGLHDQLGIPVDYTQLFDDIRECIDEAHRDGAIVDVIRDDLPRFVDKDPALAPTLHKLRSAGKKLFLLTNSRRLYTERMMSFLLDGAMAEYPSWRHYFDIVVVAASKPAFFQGSAPFLERVGDTLQPAGQLDRHRIYEGGNLTDFERLAGCRGEEVLYVGDHIYGDILRSKKESAWRTMMIVQEMAQESVAMEATRTEVERVEALSRQRARLEDELRFRQAHLKSVLRALEGLSAEAPTYEALEAERVSDKRAIEQVRGALHEIDSEVDTLTRRVDQEFHPIWGSIFKQGAELSSFGDQVEDYACLYTSRVSNLVHYSPLFFYRSPRDLMPHEIP